MLSVQAADLTCDARAPNENWLAAFMTAEGRDKEKLCEYWAWFKSLVHTLATSTPVLCYALGHAEIQRMLNAY